MRIEVIIPTRGRPERLLEAIASIQDPSHEEWRAYIVDDGDGDGVRAASLAADPRVVAFQNPGFGQVEARNAALQIADGDIVMLFDDENLLLDPDHMHEVVRHLATGPALVHRGGWLLFAEDGRETDLEPFLPPADPESLRRDNTILTCGLAWARTLHDRLGVGYRIHGANASTHRTASRTAAFERFRAKHKLAVEEKDHLTVPRERVGGGSRGLTADRPGLPVHDLHAGA